MESLDQKQTARLQAAQTRASIDQTTRQLASIKVASLPFPVQLTPRSKVLSGFFPFKDEIDTFPLMGALAAAGWTCSLPVVVGRNQPLLFRSWYPGEPTQSGKWNIPVPLTGAPEVDPDVVLVPMLAFDNEGYRLGYGGGFYDLTLAKLRALKSVVAIGVAYSQQEIDCVPREPHDQPLDYMMTDIGVRRCG
jgi:5-formyltetrahydrofolate cyclo-ligase